MPSFRFHLLVSALFFFSSILAFCGELKIKVVDPQGAVVPAARVLLSRNQNPGKTVLVDTTDSRGEVRFANAVPGLEYHVRVLAAGFAVNDQDVRVEEIGSITARLSLAPVAETVQVSATRTPLPTEDSVAPVTSLDFGQLTTMLPISASDALRFLPGVILSDAGQRGGQTSLFVRGGDSRYNKVIVDGVTVNDPGGTFDFGVLPMDQIDRMEFVRGAESTLYGSDAMTSVVQMWSRTGTSRTPEIRFGADGGTFETANGYASVAGARGRLDYNVFGQQFNTNGQGINDRYSNSSQGANVGVRLTDASFFRFRTRHSNNWTGIPGEWNFNDQALLPPDNDQRARQNNFLASGEIVVTEPARWQHRLTGFEYNHKRTITDTLMDPGRETAAYGPIDFSFRDIANINRAGFEYEGEYWLRDWAQSTFGYRFEDENGFVGEQMSMVPGTLLPVQYTHGLRRNHDVFGEQVITWKRVSLIAGGRYVHNESFGDKFVPRVASSLVIRQGGEALGATRLKFAYATGIKEPRLEESFGIGAFNIVPNPGLRAERNRSFESGVQQNFWGGKAYASATYFNNLFRDQIAYFFNSVNFTSQYVNLNKAMAHGAELDLHAQLKPRISVDAGYTYTSTQILQAPPCSLDLGCDPLLQGAGAPLLRRPKHAGSLLLTYVGSRWGGSLGGSFVGRRRDSDFLGLVPPIRSIAGYALVDLGAWYNLNKHATAYVSIGNMLNRQYEEASGYPALRANFRAGMRFRFGGEEHGKT